ncbi:HPr kinase/phosphorylase [Novosphingobium sp. CCH12-A3]|uniref:HPr kinase/phosphorylase n=1 Tax=Novosphingobium sp. CCH12-A3 TaxID=1768752 RepID=UPI0007867506|nr:HPr kinase/phosphatase C-terminal domain-containing protein [Novosphingobium sp. CCH12-A3]
MSRAVQLTCVAIGGRGLLIAGAPGTGKSSLALALIDRGAVLVGDDGVMVEAREGRLIVAAHPNTVGKLEVRNLGILDFPVSAPVPAALLVQLDSTAPRFIEQAQAYEMEGIRIPCVALWPESPVLPLRAELALARYGLTFS